MDEAQKLFQIRKTVLQMLNARDYIIPEDDLKETKEEFQKKWDEQFNYNRELLKYKTGNKKGDSLTVFFPNSDEKLGVKELKGILEEIGDDRRAIIVMKAGITPFAKNLLSLTEYNDFTVERFNERELLVNITEHQLVPAHVPLDDKQKNILLNKYKLQETQLPRIKVTDPVARFYGLTKGQVVKIIRPSETAGRYVTYRLVI